MSDIEQEIKDWLRNTVVGLNLCPFAAQPIEQDRVKIVVSGANFEAELLEQLQYELLNIDQQSDSILETTLIILPKMLADFNDYNQFLDLVDILLTENNWIGEYQIATFHPNYQFADTRPDDAENLTNRSPYPILQILREASIERQLMQFENPESIPERNIKKMNSLSEQDKSQYFPYLYTKNDG